MKRLLRLLLGLTLLVPAAGCGGVPVTPSPTPLAGNVVTIGFTTSMTGVYVNESTDQTNGIKLWIQQTNDAGGIRLANGDIVTFAYKTYDDESNATQADAMYKDLVKKDKVDFLFGPYSSSLTNAAALVANQNQKIMLSAGAAADISFQRNFRTVYQVYTPASRYFTPALDILSTVDPNANRIAVLHESDAFATTAALAIVPVIQSKGFYAVYTESYLTGTTDFSSFVQKIANAKPDAILAGGHFQDGMLLTQEMARQGVTAKLVVLLVSPAEPAFGDIGIPAVGIIGPSQWEPDIVYSAANAYSAGILFYGPTSPNFILAYRQAYRKDPTYFAAGGYAAGLVLQHAIEQAGTLDQSTILSALDTTRIMTFFGMQQFDISAKNHGLQIGHEMVYVQWQVDSSGALVKRVVWPVNLAIAPLTYPKP